MDRLQFNNDDLKEQFETYCKCNQSKADNSSQSETSGGSSETFGCSSEVSAGNQSSGSLVMTQKVIQHFNTLGIDLRTFRN